MECMYDNVIKFRVKTNCVPTLIYVFFNEKEIFLSAKTFQCSVEGYFCNFLCDNSCVQSNKTVKTH